VGVGQIFGAIGMGYIVDTIGPKRSTFVNIGLILL